MSYCSGTSCYLDIHPLCYAARLLFGKCAEISCQSSFERICWEITYRCESASCAIEHRCSCIYAQTSGPICASESASVANDAWWAAGSREAKLKAPGKKKKKKEAREESVNSVLPPSLLLVALCLHGAHILSGELLSSLVWPDLFTLQARLQLSNTYQNIYSLSLSLSLSLSAP